jgi:hypothetical protein
MAEMRGWREGEIYRGESWGGGRGWVGVVDRMSSDTTVSLCAQ